MTRLNLGCGRQKLPGFVNVDHAPSEGPDVVCELGRDHWPWDNNSVDEAIASHILEHLPGDEFFHFLHELYRVMKPGGAVRITLPHPSNDIFLCDPTHARPVMPGTMAMFSKNYVESLAAKGMFLTPFYERYGVDFAFSDLSYTLEEGIDPNAPDLEWQAKHLRNVVREWSATLTAVK